MQRTELMTEATAIVAEILPASKNAGSYNTAAFNAGLAGEFLVEIDIGDVGAAGKVDVKVQASATSAGTYADVPSCAIPQQGATGHVLFGVRATRLRDANVGPWVKVVVTVSGNAVVLGVRVRQAKTHYKPESDYNLSNVC